jgi:hypothetical protein
MRMGEPMCRRFRVALEAFKLPVLSLEVRSCHPTLCCLATTLAGGIQIWNDCEVLWG